MSTSGTYEELLSCGGKLKVTKSSWEIVYYFPGPDLRHNGTFVSIPGKSIQQYIDAYTENWLEYQKLKESIPCGADFSKDVKMGMSIRIGRFNEGVCLRSYHMPISSTERLNLVLDGYRYSAKRVPEIQKFLATL